MRFTRRQMLEGGMGALAGLYLGAEFKKSSIANGQDVQSDEKVPPRQIDKDIQNVADSIMRRRDAAGNEPTLFVIAGENHFESSNVILRLGVIRQLHERGYKLGCGYEYPYNSVLLDIPSGRDLTRKSVHASLNQDMQLLLAEYFDCDFDGTVSLAMQTTQSLSLGSSVANKLLFRYLLDEEVPYRNNDLSRSDGFIETDDLLFLEFVRRFSFPWDGKSPVSSSVREGVYARNLFMTWFSGQHAQDANAEIYIQHCGYDHTFGNGNDLPFDESIAAIFQKEQRPFMALQYSDKDYPDLSKILPGVCIPVAALPDRSFAYYDELSGDQKRELEKKELAYINRLVSMPYEANMAKTPEMNEVLAKLKVSPPECKGTLVDQILRPEAQPF